MAAASLGLAGGCVGTIGGDEVTGGGGPTAGGSQNAGAGTTSIISSTAVSDLPLPRLSRDEYVQTVNDLIQQVLPAAASQVLVGIKSLTDALPADALVTTATEKHGGFARDDQSEQQEYSDTPVAVAMALGKAMTSSPDRISALFGDCSQAGASVDSACLSSFVKTFGQIALRHPLSDDDVAFYAGTAANNPPSKTDLANVISVMLSSPRFLYRVESGGQQVSDSVYQLDAWELAARLSYHLWGTMPDAALRGAASSGKLLTEGGYSAEIDRMMADPRADSTLRTFFEQWFWPLLELPALDGRASDPVFRGFAGANLPGPTLTDHMVADVLDTTSWVTSHGGRVSDLLTNQMSFAKDADLAAIYGTPPWDGQSPPHALPGARAGLLTRAAFLSTGTINTRPIMKGVFIRSTLLCDTLPPPPPNAANTPVMTGANQTTRQVIESITEQPGTVCASCHTTQINPLGFASENFDSLGRERVQQAFFDASGNVIGGKNVDTTSIPAVVAGDSQASTGMADVTRLIAQSGQVEKCMATRFFRFAFRRLETDADTATVAAFAQMAAGGTLADLFKGVVLRAEFRRRVITP